VAQVVVMTRSDMHVCVKVNAGVKERMAPVPVDGWSTQKALGGCTVDNNQ